MTRPCLLSSIVFDKGITVKSLNEIKSVLVSPLASHGQISDVLIIYDEIKQAKCYLEPKAIICLIKNLECKRQLSRLLQLLEELNDPDYWVDGCFRVILYCVRYKHLSSTVDLLKQLKDKFYANEVATDVLFDEVFSLIAETDPVDLQFGLNMLKAIKDELNICPSRKSLEFLLSACLAVLGGSLLGTFLFEKANGCELAFISLLACKNSFRIPESLPSLHDNVLAAAAEAAICFSFNQKKKQGTAPRILGGIVKGFKGGKVNHTNDGTLASTSNYSHLEGVFSRNPFPDPSSIMVDNPEATELNIEVEAVNTGLLLSSDSATNWSFEFASALGIAHS